MEGVMMNNSASSGAADMPDAARTASTPAVVASQEPRAAAAEVVLDGEQAVAVVDLTRSGPMLRWANTAFQRITGYTARQGRARGDVISPGYRSVVLAEIAEHAIDGASFP